MNLKLKYLKYKKKYLNLIKDIYGKGDKGYLSESEEEDSDYEDRGRKSPLLSFTGKKISKKEEKKIKEKEEFRKQKKEINKMMSEDAMSDINFSSETGKPKNRQEEIEKRLAVLRKNSSSTFDGEKSDDDLIRYLTGETDELKTNSDKSEEDSKSEEESKSNEESKSEDESKNKKLEFKSNLTLAMEEKNKSPVNLLTQSMIEMKEKEEKNKSPVSLLTQSMIEMKEKEEESRFNPIKINLSDSISSYLFAIEARNTIYGLTYCSYKIVHNWLYRNKGNVNIIEMTKDLINLSLELCSEFKNLKILYPKPEDFESVKNFREQYIPKNVENLCKWNNFEKKTFTNVLTNTKDVIDWYKDLETIDLQFKEFYDNFKKITMEQIRVELPKILKKFDAQFPIGLEI